MSLDHALVLLLLAPSERGEAPSSERGYVGIDAVVAPAEPAERSIANETSTDPPEELRSRPERIEDESAPPIPRSLPRMLTTMQGWYPGEEAVHWNRAGNFSFTPGMQVRSRVGTVSEFRMDERNTHDEGAFAAGRIRWRPVFGFGRRQNVLLVGMLDVANGRWVPRQSGDALTQEILDDGQPPHAWGMRTVDPRELYLDWTTPYGRLFLGQMSFAWGLGLLANDGNNVDRFGDLGFGDDGDGSLQERIMFATKPLARSDGPGKDIVLAVGADLIYRDPNADLIAGDRAAQVFLVLRYEPESRPGDWLGVYGVYRRQRNADDGDIYPEDDFLEVGVVDFAGQAFEVLREDLALIGAFEAVAIAGRTTFASGMFREQQVLQAAAALRAYIGNPAIWLAGLDAGWASGDANPNDLEINDFKAAPGFNVGLLLFDYVLGWQSARAEMRARDPALAAVPPNGVQYIPSQGSVTNALYVHPKARYGLWERLEIWGGPLVAASAVPLVDPVSTRLDGGGVPTNALGGPSDRRYLGTELDLGVRGRYDFANLWVQAGVQAGVLFPGPALRDARGQTDAPIWGTWFRAELRY
jgi:hypothetical protein